MKGQTEKMQNRLIIRWELTPVEKFEEFLLELLKYIKAELTAFRNGFGEVEWTCGQDHFNPDPGKAPFERVANFCMERNLNPHEVIDMIDEYTDNHHLCECCLLKDEKIQKLIERSK
jgi:hypothetical protein